MAPRSRSNPLALAVLGCLYERPMHPYEISQTLRLRATDASVRLNFGSLYGVVASLEKRHLIRSVETLRSGKRPPRTVYEITEAGRTEMNEWLSELVAVPVKEYLQFEAGLALIGGLPPDDAVGLLRQRCEALEIRLDQAQAIHEAMAKRGIPRMFAIESEYQAALAQAELAFTRGLVDDIDAGTLGGLDEWRAWHDAADTVEYGATPPTGDTGDTENNTENDDDSDVEDNDVTENGGTR